MSITKGQTSCTQLRKSCQNWRTSIMETSKEIRRLTRILELFRQHDERMSVSEALVFLMAADADKFEHQKDIEDRLGIANSTCSRYVSYWSEFVRPDEPG